LDPSLGKTELHIYDVNGRLILIDRFAGKKRIDGIKPGLYFLKFTGANGNAVRTIFVK
jgi:hypothetical protein